MITILWIVAAILWTLVVMIVGYAGGKQAKIDIRTGETGVPGVTGATGSTGETGPVGPPGKCECEDRVSDLEENIVDINSILSGFNDRFTRVERKAGMSV